MTNFRKGGCSYCWVKIWITGILEGVDVVIVELKFEWQILEGVDVVIVELKFEWQILERVDVVIVELKSEQRMKFFKFFELLISFNKIFSYFHLLNVIFQGNHYIYIIINYNIVILFKGINILCFS